jgi:hypothetical protein
VLTCLALVGLFAGAMPLMAYRFEIVGTQPVYGNQSVYRVLDLDAFPELPVGSGLMTWPWLLAPLLAQAAVLYRVVRPRGRQMFLSVAGLVCAVAMPVRLLADDLWWDPVLTELPGAVSRINIVFDGGWWLLHAGALLGLVAFVWQDSAVTRKQARRRRA